MKLITSVIVAMAAISSSNVKIQAMQLNASINESVVLTSEPVYTPDEAKVKEHNNDTVPDNGSLIQSNTTFSNTQSLENATLSQMFLYY